MLAENFDQAGWKGRHVIRLGHDRGGGNEAGDRHDDATLDAQPSVELCEPPESAARGHLHIDMSQIRQLGPGQA